MQNYFENLNQTLKEYFKILSTEIPDFLNEYIQTPEMQKQAGISTSCGTYYTNLCNCKLWYSSLDHSVAVALIIWNFTKNKKQALSGLFHDIATPAFKHCVDFMNGDYIEQESTEKMTTEIIKNSKEIMRLLNRDNIKIEEVDNYHIYPIADNETPQLSSDRLEYTLSNALGGEKIILNIEQIKEIYNNIEIQKNEQGIKEIGFKDKEIAEKFVGVMGILSSSYIKPENKFSMQFLADTLKKMQEQNLITIDDLYKLSEKQIIEKIQKCDYDDISKKFDIWQNATKLHESDEEPENKYWVSVSPKIRYINPLVRHGNQYIRISDVSEQAKQDIERVLNFKTKAYAYLDF